MRVALVAYNSEDFRPQWRSISPRLAAYGWFRSISLHCSDWQWTGVSGLAAFAVRHSAASFLLRWCRPSRYFLQA